MDSDYLTPREFTGVSWDLLYLLLYIVSVSCGQLFFSYFQGLIRTSFRCSYFILPLLYFVRTLLCIHIPQINMATYNDRVAIYHNYRGKDIDHIKRVYHC